MERLRSELLAKPWSPQAFDRILLTLILAAPQFVMLAWLATNGDGVVESALWLEPAPFATRLMGIAVWTFVIVATFLAMSKRGVFVWLWLIAVAAPLYWFAFVPGASDAVAVTPLLPLAGLFGGVAMFSIADWLCALVLLSLQAALYHFEGSFELVEGDLDEFAGRGRLHRALATYGAGLGVFVAIVAWSVSLIIPNLLPGSLLGVLGVTFAALLVFVIIRRIRLAPLVFSLLSIAPYALVLNAGRLGFWPVAAQHVLVHMALMILIAAPIVWLGYGISARAASAVRSWFAPLLCAAIALVTGAGLHLVFVAFVDVIPSLIGVSLPEVRLDTAREIWFEGWWSWALVAVAAFVTFAGCWYPTRSHVRDTPATHASL